MNTTYHGPEIPNDILRVRRLRARLEGKVLNGLTREEALVLAGGKEREWKLMLCEHCHQISHGPAVSHEDVHVARYSYPESEHDEETQRLLKEAYLQKMPSEEE